MDNRKLEYFSNFLLDTSEDDINYMISELRDAGIDPVESQQKTLKMIKQKKAEIKLEKGKIFKATALKVIDRVQNENKEFEETPVFKIAARNLGKLDKQDEDEIKKNEMILKELGKMFDH